MARPKKKTHPPSPATRANAPPRRGKPSSRPPATPRAVPVAVEWRARDWLALAVSVLAPLLLYVLTLPRTVVLEDDGLFLMVGAHWGIAHPPGYPLYTLIIHLFMQLPFGSPAFLGHLSSAFLGALACGGVYACARLLGASRVPAVTAAWLFAASEHFWAQAIIAEVYTLNALLFFATYALILSGVRRPHNRKIWLAAAVVYGLSLANHWPLMALAFPGLLVAAWPAWRTVRRRLPELAAAAAASAALPYAWMVLRSLQEPLMSFYGAIDSVKALVKYISRQDYAGVDVSPSAGWGDRLEFLGWFGNEVVWQLTLPGFVLMLVGLNALFRRGQTAEAYSGLLVFAGASVVLIALLAFDFESFSVAVFRPYSLVCYGLAALWLAVGFQSLLEHRFVAAAAPWLKTGVAALAGLGMTAASVHAHWAINDRSGSDFTERYANAVFGLVPQNAVLLVYGDTDTASLGYYRFVEQRRPDIALMNVQGILYGNRLYPPHLSQRKKEDRLRAFVRTTERPVFLTTNAADRKMFTDSAIRHYAFVQEVRRGGDPGSIQLQLNPEATRYFESLIASKPSDGWERYLRNLLIAQYGDFLGYALVSGDPELLGKIEPMVAVAQGSFYSLMGMSEVLMQYGNKVHWERLQGWLEQAGEMHDEALTKNLRSRLYYLQGYLYAKLERREEAITQFQKAYTAYPHPENGAINALQQLGVPLE